MLIIKQITIKEVNALIKLGILKNTYMGIVNSKDEPVGYYVTRNKRYIEDKYADMAHNINK